MWRGSHVGRVVWTRWCHDLGSSAYSFPTPCAFLALASTCFKNVKIPCLFSRLQLLVLQILFTFLFDNHFPFLIFVHIFITRLLDNAWIYCGSIYPWFKLLIPLFQIHYHTSQYLKTKTKNKKFEPRIKLNHNRYFSEKLLPGHYYEWKGRG